MTIDGTLNGGGSSGSQFAPDTYIVLVEIDGVPSGEIDDLGSFLAPESVFPLNLHLTIDDPSSSCFWVADTVLLPGQTFIGNIVFEFEC